MGVSEGALACMQEHTCAHGCGRQSTTLDVFVIFRSLPPVYLFMSISETEYPSWPRIYQLG